MEKKERGVQWSCDRCKGDGSSQRSYDRWGGGGRHFGSVGPANLGPSGQDFLVRAFLFA